MTAPEAPGLRERIDALDRLHFGSTGGEQYVRLDDVRAALAPSVPSIDDEVVAAWRAWQDTGAFRGDTPIRDAFAAGWDARAVSEWRHAPRVRMRRRSALDEEYTRHSYGEPVPAGTECGGCRQTWPCDAEQTRLRAERAEQELDVERLARAIAGLTERIGIEFWREPITGSASLIAAEYERLGAK